MSVQKKIDKYIAKQESVKNSFQKAMERTIRINKKLVAALDSMVDVILSRRFDARNEVLDAEAIIESLDVKNANVKYEPEKTK